jgi:tetratricopeptide (TPR) repeat protein
MPNAAKPRSSLNRPTDLQKLAAFVVGVLMLGALFASALFGLVAPEHVNRIVRLCIAVAGGGFALFLLGYFDWHLPNGMQIGGPLGIFVLLLIWDPGQKLPELVNTNFQVCKDNVQRGEDAIAEAYCAKAVEDLPKSPEARYWLAAAQFHEGSYNEAIASWTKALELGADPARTNYNIAFANFRVGKYEDAIKAASAAADATTTNPALRARSLFMIANAEFSLWNYGSGADDHFKNAAAQYQAFLEIGSPKYKARAELACLMAVKAELTNDDQQKKNYDQQAISNFEEALNSVKAYNAGSSQDIQAEKAAFVGAYRPHAGKCGASLSQAWQRMRPTENYVEVLSSVQT